MFIPTSKILRSARLLLLGLCGLMVTACSDMPLVSQLSSSAFSGAGTGPSRVYRTPSGIELNTPRRYCVDSEESRSDSDGSFVLMAACGTLGVGTALSPSVDGILTVTIAAPDASIDFRGAERDLVAVLSAQSEELGETIISASEMSEGRVVLTVREGAGLSPLSWRGFVMLRGQMTTVSLKSYRDAPLTDDDGRAFLQRTLTRFEEDNVTADVVAFQPTVSGGALRPVLRPGGS